MEGECLETSTLPVFMLCYLINFVTNDYGVVLSKMANILSEACKLHEEDILEIEEALEAHEAQSWMC